MKFLLSSGIGYRTHTLAALEKLALSEGFDGLELNLPPRHLPPEETIRDTSYDLLSAVGAIHAPGDLYDQKRFASALNDSVALAKTLKVPLINIHPPALSAGGRANVERGIDLIQRKTAETNLAITYEVLVNPYGLEKERRPYFIKQQAYESLEDYAADVKQHNLAATLDTAHVGAWGVDPRQFIRMLGANLKHVHLSDYSASLQREHLLLGQGDLDLAGFLQVLKGTAPAMTVTVELHSPRTKEEVKQAVRQSRQYIMQALGNE